MSRLDDILFFQSEPMSGNMLADWQIKQAKEEIKNLIIELIGVSPGIHNRDEKCCDKCNLRVELHKKVEQL